MHKRQYYLFAEILHSLPKFNESGNLTREMVNVLFVAQKILRKWSTLIHELKSILLILRAHIYQKIFGFFCTHIKKKIDKFDLNSEHKTS